MGGSLGGGRYLSDYRALHRYQDDTLRLPHPGPEPAPHKEWFASQGKNTLPDPLLLS